MNRQIAAAATAQADLEKVLENYRAALADGRTDTMVYFAAWNDVVDAKAKVFTLKGQLARAMVALELETGFYEIPEPDSLSNAAPIAPDKEKRQ